MMALVVWTTYVFLFKQSEEKYAPTEVDVEANDRPKDSVGPSFVSAFKVLGLIGITL